MYRLGWPLATFFAELGLPLLIKVEIIHDSETAELLTLDKSKVTRKMPQRIYRLLT